MIIELFWLIQIHQHETAALVLWLWHVFFCLFALKTLPRLMPQHGVLQANQIKQRAHRVVVSQ